MFLNFVLVVLLIFIVIVNKAKVRDLISSIYTRGREMLNSIKKFQLKNLFKNVVVIYQDKELKRNLWDSTCKYLTINSIKKIIGTILIILMLIIINIDIPKFYKFIVIESTMIFGLKVVLDLIKKGEQIMQVFLGQLYIPLIGIVFALTFMGLDLENEKFNYIVFVVSMTSLVLSIYLSISLYHYNIKNNYKIIHLIFSYINIGLACVIMLTYIGYGYMVFEYKNLGINQSKVTLNIDGHINEMNSITAYMSYGLDRLSQNSGIIVSKNKSDTSVSVDMLKFGLLSKGFMSIYFALVIAFICNTLLNNKKVRL